MHDIKAKTDIIECGVIPELIRIGNLDIEEEHGARGEISHFERNNC